MQNQTEQATPYQLFMLVLCLVVLGVLAVEATVELDGETRRIVLIFDTVVAFIFLGDFARSLHRAEDRTRYLMTWGWIDFLSSIPSVAILRWGRAARVARLFRVLRGLRSARFLASVVLRKRAQSAALAAALLGLLTTFFGSIAVLRVERPAGGNIQTAGDALWWAVATLSTAGFGDLYPITPEGRAIAVGLMIVGIGLFGAVTGLFASWVVGGVTDPDLGSTR